MKAFTCRFWSRYKTHTRGGFSRQFALLVLRCRQRKSELWAFAFTSSWTKREGSPSRTEYPSFPQAAGSSPIIACPWTNKGKQRNAYTSLPQMKQWTLQGRMKSAAPLSPGGAVNTEIIRIFTKEYGEIGVGWMMNRIHSSELLKWHFHFLVFLLSP